MQRREPRQRTLSPFLQSLVSHPLEFQALFFKLGIRASPRYFHNLPTMSQQDGDQPQSQQPSIPPFFKGFMAGVLLSHLNRQLMVGGMIGTVAGLYFQQEYGAPDVQDKLAQIRKQIDDFLSKASNKDD
eukprot:m.150808 g.150808  ORF g.150808 m.150808 type:complete len:129 (+) comp14238_c0_seq2:392-778(+)